MCEQTYPPVEDVVEVGQQHHGELFKGHPPGDVDRHLLLVPPVLLLVQHRGEDLRALHQDVLKQAVQEVGLLRRDVLQNTTTHTDTNTFSIKVTQYRRMKDQKQKSET